eukprot:CAMPEP_0172598930 /NCGR_PEP_ID=MMETSP1068-20121228/19020_1 /TAXON_ID=35684 /ORGANISM="Pseudopedinella elastica, Strain CCMP716" /LENGTH=448 /DNA_ID=CAMNT_0013399009 /DNA_START=391 /DNA_END=1737 /DNA_ORIENTATION=+
MFSKAVAEAFVNMEPDDSSRQRKAPRALSIGPVVLDQGPVGTKRSSAEASEGSKPVTPREKAQFDNPGKSRGFRLAFSFVWNLKLVNLAVVAGFLAIALDFWHRGLSSSNGRFISFLASLNNCYSFRAQRALTPLRKGRRRDSFEEWKRKHAYTISAYLGSSLWGAAARTAGLSFLLKYGASTVVSLLLWTTPVFLKGPRHVSYFLLALGLVQFSPKDAVFRTMKGSPWVQLMVACAIALYKLRKLVFLVHYFADPFHPKPGSLVGWALPSALPLANELAELLVLTTIALDGNGLARRVENVLSHRGLDTSTVRRFLGEAWLAVCFFWRRNFALLLATAMLHFASAGCQRLAAGVTAGRGASPRFLGWWELALVLACGAERTAQLGALVVMAERQRIWKADPGERSLLGRIARQYRGEPEQPMSPGYVTPRKYVPHLRPASPPDLRLD